MEPLNQIENQTPPTSHQTTVPILNPVVTQNTPTQPLTSSEQNIKKDWTKVFDTKLATIFLIISIVSFVIFPFMAETAIIMSSIGLYSGIKNKFGKKHMILSILSIIIGFLSLITNAF